MTKENILDHLFEKHSPKDRAMRMAWLSFIRYSLGKEEIIERYKKETGDNYTPPKTVITSFSFFVKSLNGNIDTLLILPVLKELEYSIPLKGQKIKKGYKFYKVKKLNKEGKIYFKMFFSLKFFNFFFGVDYKMDKRIVSNFLLFDNKGNKSNMYRYDSNKKR